MALLEKLGKYELHGIVGAGAMGVVYKGIDPVIRRPVAVKTIQRTLLQPDGATDGIAARFRNEAQAAGRLSHPGIVSIYEYGEDAGVSYIAMEFVEGRDLGRLLASEPFLPDGMVLDIMEQLLEALDHAHERGVWHRDIKPANLILTRSGQLKITDFGVARIQGAGLTRIASAIGTHGYMAPEQYAGQGCDQRVDIFAAGALLYLLLTGRPAFAAASPEAAMYKVLHETPVAPSACARMRRGLELDAVVARAIAKAPSERYASAREFRDLLRQAAIQGVSRLLDDGDTQVEPHALSSACGAFHPRGHTASDLDDETVSRLEKTLASFIGPLAKLLVKRAASTQPDLRSLVQQLATHLARADERERFIAMASSAIGTRPMQAPASPQRPSSQQPMSDQLVWHATRVLAARMGPIAKLVVANAAARALDPASFFEALLADSGEAVERDRLLRELKAGWSESMRPAAESPQIAKQAIG